MSASIRSVPTTIKERLAVALFVTLVALTAALVLRPMPAHASSTGCTGSNPRTCFTISGSGLHVNTFKVAASWTGSLCNTKAKVVVTDQVNGQQWIYGPLSYSPCVSSAITYVWNPNKTYPHLSYACGYFFAVGVWRSPACNTIHA
jgi:hypothetical protein